MPTTYPTGSRFQPTKLGLVKLYLKDNDTTNDVVLPNQEQQEAGFAYHGAEDDMPGCEPMPIFNEANQKHEQQQDSPTLLLPPLQQSNDNQEHYPLEDIVFDGAYDDLAFDIDELLEPLPPLQSNDSHGQCPSWDTLFLPSQVENKDNKNIVLPNQEQREAGFANHNVTKMVEKVTKMVEKEHGDVKQQDPEQKQKALLSLLLDPEWDDFDFDDGAENDWFMQYMDEGMEQELQELEKELIKLMEPVPQPQDSGTGVHADQVMPKD